MKDHGLSFAHIKAFRSLIILFGLGYLIGHLLKLDRYYGDIKK